MTDGRRAVHGDGSAATSFDLFGTLVTVDRPADPAAAVATELRRRGVSVPEDWSDVYARSHVTVDDGEALSLVDHVAAALASRNRSADVETVAGAVRAAFAADVTTREGAVSATDAAGDRGPVGVLSNCSVPGLVERTLAASALDPAAFDAVVASVDLGWRKPHPEAFAAVARDLGTTTDRLVHVGDNPATDGRADCVGATPVLVDETQLADLPALFGRGSV